MKLLFLGAKGEIEEFTEHHRYHASLMITSGPTGLLIDYGMLHRYTMAELSPRAVLITHAHPDTYVWLKQDVKTDIPVFVTRETMDYGKYRPENAVLMATGKKYKTGAIKWSCYQVVHSIRCPAVGFKVTVEGKTLVYNSDVADIPDREHVLAGVDYYIGDGSAIRANLIRRRGDKIFGHARISTQVNWCLAYGIKNIIFTHLGKETLEKEERFKQEHPEVVLTHDGMELVI